MKKIITILGVSVLLVACQKPAEPPPPPRPALVVVVGKSSANDAMVLVGEVKSRYESNQGFRINGKIIERKVEVGSFVKKGQVLARLDAADADLSTQAASADVQAAEASHALAKAEVERQRTLFNKKFISASALDMREAELKTSAARLAQVKAQAAVSGNQSRYTALIADRDGVVTQINAEPGQVVEAGAMIAQIVDTKQIEVLVAVPESRMSKLKVGNKVNIRLWADREKTYAGMVREISPVANSATRAFDVRVAVTDVDEAVKLGMTAGVSFTETAADEIIVPSTALTQINGKNSVWVIENQSDISGVANPREVTTGPYTEAGVVIKSGLQANEMVAISGVHTLIKGQRVKPQIVDTKSESAP
ncbi:efflux RND transporter periplasmic adaptor subunit [Methylotenera sp.]|uniref:efflux RND transporter periplasmic adaptor subunit n=1 Tax=Methylotenera sp. TaxID=2051956 RepID=UPI0027303232|nr:efflux RND transporter periplasmic adaptor subunit [Methylotenera sp.]MDP2230877.1 efflux RND transporter periplasmic adaptor subunit [Methylotenera sp.]MDP3140293.1 efflux RND transporter periplasmic adaptor subunit [Methylotenera sp.]